MVYIDYMKTIDQEILVAVDPSPSHEREERLSTRRRLRGNAASQRWWKSLNLPENWHVSESPIQTLIQRKVAPPITVIDEAHYGTNHVMKVAASLAEVQGGSSGTAFVVFFCGHGLRNMVADRVKLLSPFPQPERVEIAYTLKEAGESIREVIAKWQVLQMRMAPAKPSPLDSIQEVVQGTQDLRGDDGNLSAKKVATLFGLTLRELALLLQRTPQAVNKTPAADSLQDALAYFERIARLRGILKDDASFRKWLRIANPTLEGDAPLKLVQARQWQELADLVEDILTGSPT